MNAQARAGLGQEPLTYPEPLISMQELDWYRRQLVNGPAALQFALEMTDGFTAELAAKAARVLWDHNQAALPPVRRS